MDAPGITPRLAGRDHGPDDDLTWLPAWQIGAGIARRRWSPVEVTDHFLTRIDALDPHLHAFRMVARDSARAQARAAETAVMAGEPLGPLHGIPIAIKELLPVAGMAWLDTFTGRHTVAERDSLEVARLRAAGAIILGTTVGGLTAREFGDSDRQPQNPWDRNRVCGDSSAGSACALAAGMVPLAIAADGLGSTRLPAAFCGLVGLHVTRGRIAVADWQQLNPRLLSGTGPLTRDTRDAGLALGVLASADGHDLMCLASDPPDYLATLASGARGMRLAWTDDFGFAGARAGSRSAAVIAAVRQAAATLREAGAELFEMAERIDDPFAACATIMSSDRSTVVRTEPPREAVATAREVRNGVWQTLRQTLAGADFILSPTIQYIAPTRGEWHAAWTDASYSAGYMGTYSAHTSVANLLGWPAISVPAGLVDGMPVGLQILGSPDSEPRMLQLAEAFLARR